jgi:hypothetical protein
MDGGGDFLKPLSVHDPGTCQLVGEDLNFGVVQGEAALKPCAFQADPCEDAFELRHDLAPAHLRVKPPPPAFAALPAQHALQIGRPEQLALAALKQRSHGQFGKAAKEEIAGGLRQQPRFQRLACAPLVFIDRSATIGDDLHREAAREAGGTACVPADAEKFLLQCGNGGGGPVVAAAKKILLLGSLGELGGLMAQTMQLAAWIEKRKLRRVVLARTAPSPLHGGTPYTFHQSRLDLQPVQIVVGVPRRSFIKGRLKKRPPGVRHVGFEFDQYAGAM